jgi:hypothetical protein
MPASTGRAMSPYISLSCDTLQSLKWTDVYDANGLKRSNKHTGSGMQRYIR